MVAGETHGEPDATGVVWLSAYIIEGVYRFVKLTAAGCSVIHFHTVWLAPMFGPPAGDKPWIGAPIAVD